MDKTEEKDWRVKLEFAYNRKHLVSKKESPKDLTAKKKEMF